MSFSWLAASASLRDSASRALRSAASTRSFFSPRRGAPMAIRWPARALNTSHNVSALATAWLKSTSRGAGRSR